MNLASLLAAAKLTRPIRREIAVTPRVINEQDGTVEFVASDATLDSYREIVDPRGWRFTHFAKNAPFVDSHDYSSITKLLGQVTAWRLEKGQLIETVRYSREPGTLAEWAFKMVRDGFLKAVSVGFVPVRMASKFDSSPGSLNQAIAELGLDAQTGAQVRAIYLEQEQIELSQCVIGANPNALARAYKAGCLSEQDLDQLSAVIAASKTSTAAEPPEPAAVLSARAKAAILAKIQLEISK